MVENTVTSEQLFEEAQEHLVGGVNSPVRAFKAIGQHPVFFSKGKGATLYSEDQKTYIDFVLSWGPLILGHAQDDVVEAIHQAAQNGTSFGAPTVLETELATRIQKDYPHMERLRFVNSGTEASMSAIRLARGVTGRRKILKFKGCYHGHADSLLVAAGSGGLTFSVPDSKGVLDEVAAQTVVLSYNDAEGVKDVFASVGSDIAAVILEPICGNMGVIYPTQLFLDAIQDACQTYGALLIFDEVMWGYRTDKLSASQLFGVSPDLTILGKVIGGGLPCGAYGGKKEIMMQLSPEGPVYQAGTLSGNPLVMAAGLKTLELIEEKNVVEVLADRCKRFVSDLEVFVKEHQLNVSFTQSGSMFSLFFSEKAPTNLEEVSQTNISLFPTFYKLMLEEGVYLAPSAYEANFLSIDHDAAVLAQASAAFKKSLLALF